MPTAEALLQPLFAPPTDELDVAEERATRVAHEVKEDVEGDARVLSPEAFVAFIGEVHRRMHELIGSGVRPAERYAALVLIDELVEVEKPPAKPAAAAAAAAE